MVRAAAGCPFRAQSSRHGLDQPARQGEAKANTAGVVPIAKPLEWLKDLIPVSFGYPRAAVDDPDLNSSAEGAGRDLRRGVGWAVADGILHKIGDCSFQQSGVGRNLRGVFRDPNDHLVRGGSQAAYGGGDDIGDINRLNCESEGTSLQPAHIQQVLDQTAQPVQRLFNGCK